MYDTVFEMYPTTIAAICLLCFNAENNIIIFNTIARVPIRYLRRYFARAIWVGRFSSAQDHVAEKIKHKTIPWKTVFPCDSPPPSTTFRLLSTISSDYDFRVKVFGTFDRGKKKYIYIHFKFEKSRLFLTVYSRNLNTRKSLFFGEERWLDETCSEWPRYRWNLMF